MGKQKKNQEKNATQNKQTKSPYNVFKYPARLWEKTKPKIKYDEYKGVWRNVGIAGGLLVVLTVGTVIYYSYNTPMDRDTTTGTQEMKQATDDLSSEVSKEVGFEFPTKEEVDQYLTKLEKRNGDLLPMGRYNAVKEEYGEKVADCYSGGLLVSMGMSDEDKEQVTRSVRAMYEKDTTQGNLKRKVFNPAGGKLSSEGVNSGATGRDYWVDTKGFDKTGDWAVGYPVVIPYGFGEFLNGKDMQETAEKFKDKTLIHFYAFAEEDKAVKDVVKDLSTLDVKINGKQAKTPSSVVKNYGRKVDMDMGAVVSLTPKDGDATKLTLLKGGLVEVVYAIDNKVLFQDDAELQSEEVKKASLTINNVTYDIYRNPKEFKDAPIMDYSVRGDK